MRASYYFKHKFLLKYIECNHVIFDREPPDELQCTPFDQLGI